jgi:acetyltransferase-like isoleucine patch superfamily enzyme
MTPLRIRQRVQTLLAAYQRAQLWRRTRDAFTPPPLAAYANFGARSIVIPPARVESPDCIAVGEGVVVHEHAWLCVQRREGLPPPHLSIGDGTSINRFSKIVCHGRVTIGNGVVMGDRVYISDVHHEVVPNGRPGLSDPRPVVIGDNAFVGVGAVVKPGVTLGEGSYVAAAAVVYEDVPAHTLVVGDPARAVRRRSASGEWERVNETTG